MEGREINYMSVRTRFKRNKKCSVTDNAGRLIPLAHILLNTIYPIKYHNIGTHYPLLYIYTLHVPYNNIYSTYIIYICVSVYVYCCCNARLCSWNVSSSFEKYLYKYLSTYYRNSVIRYIPTWCNVYYMRTRRNVNKP